MSIIKATSGKTPASGFFLVISDRLPSAVRSCQMFGPLAHFLFLYLMFSVWCQCERPILP